MKNVVLSLVMSAIFTKVNGQCFINNDSVKYSIINTMPDFENGDYVSNSVIKVTTLDSLKLSTFRDLKKRELYELLLNEKTDWATNLILYQLYKKDALLFKVIDTREKWIISQRDKDIAYWKQKLVNKPKPPQ